MFIDRGQVRVHVTGVSTTTRNLFSCGRNLYTGEAEKIALIEMTVRIEIANIPHEGRLRMMTYL